MHVTNSETRAGMKLNCAICRGVVLAFKMVSVELITIGEIQPREEHYLQLEQGNILFFPRTPFELSEAERDVLRATGLSSSSHHKNIAYRPAADKLTRFDTSLVTDPEHLHAVM